MRAILPILCALLIATGCGFVHDPNPESVHYRFEAEPGEKFDDTMESDRHYDGGWAWDEDVDHLPKGFNYDTEDLGTDEHGHFWVDFSLKIQDWVNPGVYRFSVTYELYDGLLWRQEIRFRIEVRVLSHRAAKPAGVELTLAASVRAESDPTPDPESDGQPILLEITR